MNQLTHHDDFIEKPVQSVLEEGLQAISNIEHGIEVYPLYEYLLQSIFLKMTGFQEQKLKLIHWTIATYDDNERWEYQQNHAGKYYSDYKEKNQLFKILWAKTLTKSSILEIFGDENDCRHYRSTLYSGYESKRKKISEDISSLNCINYLSDDKKSALFGTIKSFDQKIQNLAVVSFSEIDDICKNVEQKIEGDSSLQKEEKDKEKLRIKNKIKELKEIVSKCIDDSKDEEKFGNFIARKFLETVTNHYFLLVSRSTYPEMFSGYQNMNDLKGKLIEKDEGFCCKNNKKTFNIFNPDLKLKKCCDFLYEHRNRCAHNTTSYQRNIPTLEVFADTNRQEFDNYYIRFLILILIDEIFMALFKKYKEIILWEMNV